MIHSLYSNREIFLRELVSNASDACDRLRFAALDAPGLLAGDAELAIDVDWDETARTVTVRDNGIGMSREEVIANIGTIAKSGTREFAAALSADAAKDARLIGQFGVGFYSSFLVADRVTLVTRRAGRARWRGRALGVERRGRVHDRAGRRSSGAGRQSRCTCAPRHGRIRLAPAARRHRAQVLRPHRAPDPHAKERGTRTTKAMSQRHDDETVNAASALWTRPKSEISDEQYAEFYKHVAHDLEAPLAHVHARVEGRTEYTQLLYVPAHAPFDLWDRDHRRGLKLYVRRVFIMDDAQQLLPS